MESRPGFKVKVAKVEVEVRVGVVVRATVRARAGVTARFWGWSSVVSRLISLVRGRALGTVRV